MNIYLILKRFIDILFSALLIFILSPVIILIALLVKIMIGSPVFFIQTRPGKDEKIFKMYKFRTMINKMDEDGALLPDCERLTKFGKILRGTSLDELPELINIFKGDMSFVGPRPLLIRYLPYYTQSERHRHKIRPGLTGLAQVNGRNFLKWEERFELDCDYVENCSILLDFKIILKTIRKVFIKEDVMEADIDLNMGFNDLDKERKSMYLINDLYVGQKNEIFENVTIELIEKFANCSGDYSPIHMNEEYAKNSIFRGRIAHGILSAAFISKFLGMHFPGEGTIYLEQNLKFKQAVYPGDQLRISGEVISIDRDRNICEIKTNCINQNGKIVVEGLAKVMPPKGEKNDRY